MADATIYLAKGCPFCDRAKSFLAEKEITLEEIEALPKRKTWRDVEQSYLRSEYESDCR